MIPTGPTVGLPPATELVCERRSAMDVACDTACDAALDARVSGIAAKEVGFMAPDDSVTTGWAIGAVDAGAEDAGTIGAGGDDGDDPVTAVSIVSELVGAILAGGRSGAAATCEGTITVSLDGEGVFVG
jgi:hypothetical protein